MHAAEIAFLFACGLTFSGCTASAIEAMTGRPIGLDAVSPGRMRLWVCIVLAAAAGPFVLANEALQGRRRGSMSLASVLATFAAAGFWSLAIGIVVMAMLDLASVALH